MATEARTKLPIQEFVDAIASLKDITTIHTDPNLASMRVNLMSGHGDSAISGEMVRTLEVLGIANAVAARFRGTPHYSYANRAARRAGPLWAAASEWLEHRNVNTGTPAPGESDDGYRAFLFTQLDWVHKYGTVHDGTSVNTSTCLCPVAAYLQLILRSTPWEDWAMAAAATDPDTSPLGFAWAWARTSPGIGVRTADVVALVTMGRHAHRLFVDEAVKAEEMRSDAVSDNVTKLLTEGVWAALRGVVKDGLMEAVTWLQNSPSDFEDYKRRRELGDAEELRATTQNAAKKLRDEGERYAQLLREKDAAQELEGVVVSIRTLAGFILSKAEPPAPEAVLLAIDSLATTG